MNKFSEEWNQVIKKFIAYRFEVASRDKQRVLMIPDYLDVSYENINIDVLKFFALDIRDNYPALVKKVLAINVNTLISLPIKAIIALMPKQHQDLVQILDGNELSKWVANDKLPQVMGGGGQNDFRTVPSEAPTAQEFSKSQQMNSKDTEMFLKYIEKYLK